MVRSISRPHSYGRLLWVAYAAVCAVFTIASPLVRWQAMQRPCLVASKCAQYQLDPAAVRTLSHIGIGMTAFAALNTAVSACCWLIWYGTAALILRRNPTDRGALVTAFFLVTIPVAGALGTATSGALSSLVGTITITAIVAFCLLFPDGRFVSRWTAALALFMAAFLILPSLSIPPPPIPSGIANVIPLLLFVLVVVAQVYRYRKVSNWTQRQQIKVAIFGVAVAILGIVLLWLPYGIAPFPTGNGSLYNSLSNVTGPFVVLTALPITIGIAMLRHGLWEIDRVINRALVYSALSLILAGLYVGLVLGFQALFRVVVGGNSSLAIAVSTLAIAALFGPLRTFIQRGIDRRFYRTRYDAQRTLASLSDRLRDEVDIGQLARNVEGAVTITLQPQSLALWLRDESGVYVGTQPATDVNPAEIVKAAVTH